MRSKSDWPRSRLSAMRARRHRPHLLLPLRAERRLQLRLSQSLGKNKSRGRGRPRCYTRFEGALWLTKREHPRPRRKRQRHPKVTPNVHRSEDRDQGADREAREKAGASISGARRFASSASRKSRASTTKMFACSPNSWRKAARSCRGGLREFALRTSGDCRVRSSKRETSLCCHLPDERCDDFRLTISDCCELAMNLKSEILR